MAWQEQGPVNSLDEWVNESLVRGKEGSTKSPDSPPRDKKAPKAEPEDDMDVQEPGAQVKTLTVDATKVENQESTQINQCTPEETQEVVTELEQVPKKLSEALQTQEEPEEPDYLCEDDFPPPPSLNTSSAGEYCEKDGFSSLEGEVAEWISDDPAEDLTSVYSQNSQEWPKTPEALEQELDTDEKTGENMTAQENVTQLNFRPDGISTNNTENNMSQPTHYSPSESNNSDDVNTASSPPFADESEEEEEVGTDIMSCKQHWNTTLISSKDFQPSCSGSASISTNQEPDADPSAEQQEELLPQSQRELAPGGENQEAAQQVHGRGSPPLSTVAMELSNQGGAAPQGSACVVAARERRSRAGERTEGENQQTGGVEGQKECGLEGTEPAGQQHSGGQTIQTQELKREKYSSGVSPQRSRHTKMENDSCDDSQSDSGVSADFSPCSTMESTTNISTGTPATVSTETPIEREIRRALEREHSLRRSRGLPNKPTTPQYVEIPLRKTVLSQSLPPKSEKYQDKDREFAGKKMQHEIHEEVRREQDLVKLGKVPGSYDKGTVRQIKEKKQLFEAFQTPSDSSFTMSTRSKAPSWSSASDVSTLENQEDMSSQLSTIGSSYVERRCSLDPLSPTQGPYSAKGGGLTESTRRGPGFSEGTSCQVIILENNLSVPALNRYHVKPEAKEVTVVDSGNSYIVSSRTGDGLTEREQEKEEDEEEVVPNENPFFKLRSSTNLVKVKQDIQEAQEREKELRKQRISLYGGRGGGGGGGRPASMEGKKPMLSSSLNGLSGPDIPGSSYKRESGPSAGRQSIGKSGVWPPTQAEEEKINRPEVLQSPRTPRQKTPLVQRWESGLVNGHNKEDD